MLKTASFQVLGCVFFFGALLDQGPFLGAFIKRDGFNQAGRLLSTVPLTFPWELDTAGHAWAVPWGRAAAPRGVRHHPVALLSAFRGKQEASAAPSWRGVTPAPLSADAGLHRDRASDLPLLLFI